MVVAPVIALLTLDDKGGAPFILTAVGLLLTIAGPLLVSNRLAEPNYDVMLAWDPDAMPAGWQATRAALLHAQLDPRGSDLGRVRALSRSAGGTTPVGDAATPVQDANAGSSPGQRTRMPGRGAARKPPSRTDHPIL